MRYRWLSVTAWAAMAAGAAAVSLAAVSAVRDAVADAPVRALSSSDVDRLLENPDDPMPPYAALTERQPGDEASAARPDENSGQSAQGSAEATVLAAPAPPGAGGGQADSPVVEALATARPAEPVSPNSDTNGLDGSEPAAAEATPGAAVGAAGTAPDVAREAPDTGSAPAAVAEVPSASPSQEDPS
ncbi:MAG: hypothetical protein OEV20_06495, partial [Actinomycetota bacterium]|nr:hypothetical protein [Actinomycetota bacterium]